MKRSSHKENVSATVLNALRPGGRRRAPLPGAADSGKTLCGFLILGEAAGEAPGTGEPGELNLTLRFPSQRVKVSLVANWQESVRALGRGEIPASADRAKGQSDRRRRRERIRSALLGSRSTGLR